MKFLVFFWLQQYNGNGFCFLSLASFIHGLSCENLLCELFCCWIHFGLTQERIHKPKQAYKHKLKMMLFRGFFEKKSQGSCLCLCTIPYSSPDTWYYIIMVLKHTKTIQFLAWLGLWTKIVFLPKHKAKVQIKRMGCEMALSLLAHCSKTFAWVG